MITSDGRRVTGAVVPFAVGLLAGRGRIQPLADRHRPSCASVVNRAEEQIVLARGLDARRPGGVRQLREVSHLVKHDVRRELATGHGLGRRWGSVKVNRLRRGRVVECRHVPRKSARTNSADLEQSIDVARRDAGRFRWSGPFEPRQVTPLDQEYVIEHAADGGKARRRAETAGRGATDRPPPTPATSARS